MSLHCKLASTENMKMGRSRAFTSLPFKFSVCSAVDFVCSPVVPGWASSLYHSGTLSLTLLFPHKFYSRPPPRPPNASNARKASCSQSVSYFILPLQYLNTFKASLNQQNACLNVLKSFGTTTARTLRSASGG